MLHCLTCGASSISISDGCSELCLLMPPGNLGCLCCCWGEAAYKKSLPGSLDSWIWLGVPYTQIAGSMASYTSGSGLAHYIFEQGLLKGATAFVSSPLTPC